MILFILLELISARHFVEVFSDESTLSSWTFVNDSSLKNKAEFVHFAADVDKRHSTVMTVPKDKNRLFMIKKIDLPANKQTIQIDLLATVDSTEGDVGHVFVTLFDKDIDENMSASQPPFTIQFGPMRKNRQDMVALAINHHHPQINQTTMHVLRPPVNSQLHKNYTHLYSLVLTPAGKLTLSVDGRAVLTDIALREPGAFNPAVQPPATIPDPADTKPADWVDEAQIPDETDVKPADWDEEAPEEIPDPLFSKPAGWDEEAPLYVPDPAAAAAPAEWDVAEDGEWAAPLVMNPVCLKEDGGCGKWKAPMMRNPAYKGKFVPRKVKNPAYKGPWKAREIPNPDAYEAEEVGMMDVVKSIGVEVSTERAAIGVIGVGVTTDVPYATPEETTAAYAAATHLRTLYKARFDAEWPLRRPAMKQYQAGIRAFLLKRLQMFTKDNTAAGWCGVLRSWGLLKKVARLLYQYVQIALQEFVFDEYSAPAVGLLFAAVFLAGFLTVFGSVWLCCNPKRSRKNKAIPAPEAGAGAPATTAPTTARAGEEEAKGKKDTQAPTPTKGKQTKGPGTTVRAPSVTNPAPKQRSGTTQREGQ